MLEWLFGWEVTSVVVAVLISMALAVLALNDFKLAKAFFMFAALDAAIGILIWGTHSPRSQLARFVIGLIAIGCLLLLLVVAIRYTNRKESAKKQEALPSTEEFAKKIVEKLREDSWTLPEKVLESPTPNLSSGFVQFEGKSIAIEHEKNAGRITAGDIHVGEIIRVKFEFANRGARPALDNQSWGLIAFVDPAKNPGAKLRDVMLKGIQAGYEQFKKSGNDLGVGMRGFNFAASPPMTQEDLDALKNGSLRVHILLSGAWTDELGNRFYWTRAEWTNWPQVPLTTSFWKDS